MVRNRHISGWQNTLKIPRLVCIRAEWVHLYSWKRKHEFPGQVFKFFLQDWKDGCFCSDPFEVHYCTESFPQGLTVVWCTLVGEPFLRHLTHRWKTMFYSSKISSEQYKKLMLLTFNTFLKVRVTFSQYSTPIVNGLRPNHLHQRPAKWVKVDVRVMQMSHKRALEMHTLWDLIYFPLYLPNRATPWDPLE